MFRFENRVIALRWLLLLVLGLAAGYPFTFAHGQAVGGVLIVVTYRSVSVPEGLISRVQRGVRLQPAAFEGPQT